MERYENWREVDELFARYVSSIPKEKEIIGRELFPNVYGYLHEIAYQILHGDGWKLNIMGRSVFLRFIRDDIEVEDLVMECYPYLIEKMEKYDPNRSGASTFIGTVAGTFMKRYLSRNNGMIKIPPSVRRTSGMLKSQGINVNRTSEELIRRHRLNPYQALVAANFGPMVSLDSPLRRRDGSETSGEIYGAQSQPNPPEVLDPLEELVGSESNLIILDALNCLKPREKRFVELHYGLNGIGRRLTLEEIGRLEVIPIGRERVRQVIKISLGKARHHLESTGIKSVADILD